MLCFCLTLIKILNRETIKYAIVQQRIDNILKYSTTLTYANKYMRSKKLAKYGYPKISLLCWSQIDKLAGSILARSVNLKHQIVSGPALNMTAMRWTWERIVKLLMLWWIVPIALWNYGVSFIKVDTSNAIPTRVAGMKTDLTRRDVPR